MTLSRRDRRALAAMERMLARESILIELAGMFAEAAPARPRGRIRWLPVILAMAAGAAGAIAAAIAGLPAVAAAGIAVAAGGGVVLLVTRARTASPTGVPRPVVR